MVAVIIVTHNSEDTFDQAITSLLAQTLLPNQILVIDSGSENTQYIKKYGHEGAFEIAFLSNVGFSVANNVGFQSLDPDIRYVLFMNPDVLLETPFLEKAVQWMDVKGREKAGALTGLLLGYDFKEEKPTGYIDSTGIFSTWYGRWYDRGQGKRAKNSPYTLVESVPAICGALFFARKAALHDVLINSSQVFDENFFCYKEDIDLSCRLKKRGWQLIYLPTLLAYHARGWRKDRGQVPYASRVMSAHNELKLHWKLKNPIKILYSCLKWIGVRFFNV